MRLPKIKFQPKFSVARGRVKNQEPDWVLFGNADVLDGPNFPGLGFKNQRLDDTCLKYFFWSLLVMSYFHFDWYLFQGFSATTIISAAATGQQ